MSRPLPAAPRPWTTRERLTLAATVLGSSLAFIDGSVVNVALSAMQRDLGASVAGVQWVVNGYALMLAALILTGGALGDRFGRRRVYGLGMIVFTLASLGCGLAPNLPALVAARALQGVGGALLIPGSLAIIGAVFPDESRGRAVGLWSGATSVVTVLGPVLGGFLVDALSWRFVFFVNLPVALAALWCLRGVPESRGANAASLDWPGAILVTSGLGALAGGLTLAGEGGWTVFAVSLALGGAALLIAFVLWEARAKSPMLPLKLFRVPAFAGANALTLLLYGALGAALLYLPLYLIGVRGYGATAAGSALLPLSLLLAGLSGTFGGLADRSGPRLFLTLGPVLAGVGLALLGLLSGAGSYWGSVFPGAVVLGFGMALTVAPLTSTALGAAGRDYAGVASGVNNAVSRAAGLLAIAALSLVLLGTFRPALSERLAAAGVPETARTEMLTNSAQLARTPVPHSLPQAQRAAARRAVNAAFTAGFRAVCLWCAGLAVLAGLVGWLSLGRAKSKK